MIEVGQMKTKLIILLTALLVLTSVTPSYGAWNETQTKANQIANLARSIGLPEDNPIIQESSRLWWAEEQTKAEQEQAELMTFLNDHYADAVSMAGTMCAEARGLDCREMSMVSWCILNRLDSGRFGSSLNAVIWSKGQFAHSTRTTADNGTDLVWLAQDVLTRYWKEKRGEKNVGRTLPSGYCFYYGNGKHNLFRVNNSGKGAYEFGLVNPYD